MENRPVRVGVVGVGFGAAVHIPGFQSEGVEVIAVCTRRQERAEEAAAKFGIPNVFTDYDEMLKMPELDAVSIVSPVPLHHPMSIAALDAGKHVMCEKPFTLNQALAQEMWEKAQRSGLTAMVAHEFRFASARMRVKELLDEGYIGDMRLCLMRLVQGGFRPGAAAAPAGPQPFVPERDQAAMGAGFLWGLGSHYIDCLRHWFGEVESVSGDAVNFTPDRLSGNEVVKADADDTFSFTLHFAEGGYAQMVASRAAPFGSGAGVEIYGSGGALVTPQRGVNPPAHGTLLGAKVGDEKLVEMEIPERLQPFADDRDDRLMPFRMLAREFVRGIHEGTSPAPSFYDGLRCQQVMDAVRESSLTGRRIAIPVE
jgi:predicted dehydrogenase